MLLRFVVVGMQYFDFPVSLSPLLCFQGSHSVLAKQMSFTVKGSDIKLNEFGSQRGITKSCGSVRDFSGLVRVASSFGYHGIENK